MSAPQAEPADPRRREGGLDERAELAAIGRVALVHDYLNQRGGAEKVVLELADIWPDAPIYTSLYRPHSTFPEFRTRSVRASPLDRLPVDRGFRNLFPLYPAAFRSLGEVEADVVIASSSGWAHMVRARPHALVVVYCYTPARWLYSHDYLSALSGPQALLRPIAGAFRFLDRRAASRASLYIAISREVQQRIRSTYGIEAPVVYPPVDTERLRPQPRGERLLVIARLLPYKRIDLAVRAAARLGLGLDVVGDGPSHHELRRIAGPDTVFHGTVEQKVLVELLERCRTVCVAAEEDFGMVAVEAQAAGKPVVAYGRGGALETVVPGVTGVLFGEASEGAMASAIAAADRIETAPESIAAHASQFGRRAFRRRLLTAISECLATGADPEDGPVAGPVLPEAASAAHPRELSRAVRAPYDV